MTKPLIEKYEAEIEKLLEEIEKRKQAIEALQKLCEHNYEWAGNDSHYNHYECIWCGKMEKM